MKLVKALQTRLFVSLHRSLTLHYNASITSFPCPFMAKPHPCLNAYIFCLCPSLCSGLELSISNRWHYFLLFFYRISICLYFFTIDFQPCLCPSKDKSKINKQGYRLAKKGHKQAKKAINDVVAKNDSMIVFLAVIALLSTISCV